MAGEKDKNYDVKTPIPPQRMDPSKEPQKDENVELKEKAEKEKEKEEKK